MAYSTLRYLQDNQDDPLNDLLRGGGEPSAQGPQYDQTPPVPGDQNDQPPPNPYRQGDSGALNASLLAEKSPAARAPTAAAIVVEKPQGPSPVSEALPKAQATPVKPANDVSALLDSHRDPELDAAYRSAQMDALQHSGFEPPKYGVGEALRDNAAPLIASILDIGFNHGRGLGGIVTASANEVAKQETARGQQAKEARDFALAMRQKNNDALGQARLQYQLDSLAQRTAANQGINDRFQQNVQRQDDPNSQHNQTALNMARQRSAAITDARQDTEHDNAPRTREDAAALAAAQRNAVIGADLANAPGTRDAAAQQAAAVEQAKIPALTQAAGATAEAGELGRRAGRSEGIPVPPGFVETNADLRRATLQDAEQTTKMNADTQAARQLSQAADQLAGLRAKLGPQFLPSEGSGEYNALRLAVIGAANRAIADAGTLNGGERQLMQQLVPDVTPNYKDLLGWLSGADLNAQQLEGFAKGLQTILNSRVAGYGLGIAPQGEPQAPGAPVPAQSAAMPGYGTDYSDPRTSLGAPARAPRNPATPPPGPDGKYSVRLGNETERVTLDELKQLVRLNPKVQVVGP